MPLSVEAVAGRPGERSTPDRAMLRLGIDTRARGAYLLLAHRTPRWHWRSTVSLYLILALVLVWAMALAVAR